MYYNYYVHILQSQYRLLLVELEPHALKIVYNSIRWVIFWSFVPNFLPISVIECLLNTNIALLIGYNMEDYVSLNVHTIQTCSS